MDDLMDDDSPGIRYGTPGYEAPGIESRKDVSLPLIGLTSPPPSPSAAFRTSTSTYEPPQIDERVTIDEPLVAVAGSNTAPV
jgi:hypothetical protein